MTISIPIALCILLSHCKLCRQHQYRPIPNFFTFALVHRFAKHGIMPKTADFGRFFTAKNWEI